MIRRLSGTAIAVHPTHVVIDVQGVGYLVYTTTHAGFTEGQTVSLFTYLAVRETALDLYGFISQQELSFFEQLLTLPKIGPKSALQILSQADISLLQQTIVSQDPDHLSKMSGITKKTAEKIVFGLKDVFEGYELVSDTTSNTTEAPFTSDAIDALVTLGYPQIDARKTIQKIIAEKPEVTNANDAIREALKMLG